MAEVITTAFSFGELAPQVQGRIDLPQYQQGSESLKNMLVLPLGSARKRPGTLYISDLAYSARLIPMQISANESVIVELSNERIRVLDEDGVQEWSDTGAPWVTADLWTIKVVQSKLEMVFVGPTIAPQLLVYDGASTTMVALPCDPPTATEMPKFATATAGDRPRSVAYADERLIFGGTANEPNAVWGSEIKGLFIYMIDAGVTAVNFVAPYTDPDALEPPVISDLQPYAHIILDSGYIDIQWVKATSTVQEGLLIVGTTWGIYAIIGLNESGAISPASIISARQQSSTGCSNVSPVLIGNILVYVDSSKRSIRMLQFNLQGGGFDTPQINEFATHLFDSDVKEMHIQRAPNSRLWVVLENGKLLAFSYSPDGSLAAWTPMDFGDVEIESMTVALGESEDTLFFVMKEGTDRYLSKMASFIEKTQEEMVFSDLAVRKYHATAFSTVDGLTHLEGEEVVVFADGGMHKPMTVEAGEIELNREVNTAIVGRSYRAEMKTLPPPQAVIQIKRVSKVFVRFLESLGARADTDEFEEIVPFREGGFTMDEQPALFTGMKEIPYSGRHGRDARISIYSDDPTPFHILNLISRLEVYG